MPNLKQQEDDLTLIVSPNPGFDETSVSYFLNIIKRKSRKKSIISDKKKCEQSTLVIPDLFNSFPSLIAIK